MGMKQQQQPEIVARPIDALVPYARNARTHSDEQVAMIAASLVEFGWTNPVLIDGAAGIIAGHGRVMAARKVLESGAPIPNWPDTSQVPTIELAHLTPAQKRAYVLADNQLATRAGWDAEILAVELDELRDLDFDLSLLGFERAELNDLIGTPHTAIGLTDEDDVPPTPDEPVSVIGDVWVLGRHRLVCGDCTEAHVVEKALNGVKPHLMVTDPPYGVEYSAGWRNEAMPAKNDPKRWKDGSGSPTGAVLNDGRADWREAWSLFPGDVAYIWHAGNKAHVVAGSIEAAGLEIRAQVIWAKHQLVISRGHYHPQHEPCWYAVRKGGTGHWSGDRKQTTLWQINKPQKSETGHSTQKPVECMKRPIENNSSPGQAVYEPFSGSGTTIIAAEMTGRACHAIELSPAYVDVAVKRWQSFTGKNATLESTGETFDQVAEQRKAPEAA